MGIENMIKNREANMNNDDADFTLGTIKGLDDVQDKEINDVVVQLNTPAPVAVAPVVPSVEVAEVAELDLTDKVTIKFRKEHEQLVGILQRTNEGVIVQELDNCFQMSAKRIHVTRTEAESALGKSLTNTEWRLLLMNRTGEETEFNNDRLSLGALDIIEEEVQEQAQLNCRISARTKERMETCRKLMGSDFTQGVFLEAAIDLFISEIEKNKL